MLSSCNSKKENAKSIVIGEMDNMTIIEFDYTFKGVYIGLGEVNERTHEFDMNNDGKPDFSLTSFTDSIFTNASETNKISYGTYFKLIDDGHIKSKMVVDEMREVLLERDTLFPWQSWTTTYMLQKYSCKGVELTAIYSENYYRYIERLEKDDLITNSYNDWDQNDSKRKFIYYSNFESYEYEKLKRYDFSCFNSAYNTPFFIPIIIYKSNPSSTSDASLGWIELEILEENTIHLIRTAIQD